MKQNFLSDKSIVFAATRLGDVAAYLARHVLADNLQLAGAETNSTQLKHRRLGGVDVYQLKVAAGVRLSGWTPDDVYLLQVVIAGSCRQQADSEAPGLTEGDLVISNPHKALDLACSADCELLLITIPASLFEEVCHEHGWASGRHQTSFAAAPRRTSELPNLCALLTLLCEEAEDAVASPQMVQQYARTLACKLLTRLDNNVGTEKGDQQNDCYQRLVDYIEQNIKDEISVEALARHASISLRSLYLLFEKHANTTPRNYIRQKKLEKVYATLMDPARNIINVTAVALDYGFTHLGRFSEYYRATYGMLPSAALRNRLPEKSAHPRSTK